MKASNKKYTDLAICLVMDFLGMGTYSIPILGELGDLFWAPFSAIVFFFLFRRKMGLIGGAFNFLEEILPGTDVIPTFTLAWIGKYLVYKEKDEIIPIEKEGLKKLP
ncbi:hypothetical protein [Solitalea longa]|uniref:hypothetical protein n=1 Tax=Solitalea longa TaxID=2079460 RepID=UPI001A9C5088|nr:hypothetical protein [Solitalea longa]